MKRKKVIFYHVMLISLLQMAGCTKKTPDFETVFSSIYRDFNGQILMPAGSSPLEDAQDRGSWNQSSLKGSQQLRGLLPDQENNGAEILQRVEEFIRTRTNSFHYEGDSISTLNANQKHLYGVWIYNSGNRHGEIHVWLFPNLPDHTVAYASYIHEEAL